MSEVAMGIHERIGKNHEEIRKLVKARDVRDRFGGISASTLYRFWTSYKILPPPTKIRNICYWALADVEKALNQRAG